MALPLPALTAPDSSSSAFAPSGPVRLQTLVLLRWIAVTGQLLTILFVHYGLDFHLPLVPCLTVIGASAALNIALAMFYPMATRLSDLGAATYLALDLAQLAALLYFTGGLENPFSLLMLVPITVGAMILSLRSTLWLAILAFSLITAMLFRHLPLPWTDGPPPFLPPLFLFANWVAMLIGTLLVAAYAFRVADEGRRMRDALDATQQALSREQRLAAVGGLAAAAAHELGTPLGTITLVAKELSREVPSDSPFADDVRLLVEQAARCRDILARLARRPEAEEIGDEFGYPLFSALIEAAAEPHLHRGKHVVVLPPDGEQPQVRRSPEILHALGNLVENAVDFAEREVEVRIYCDAETVRVEVLDDGSGFDPEILSRIGDPYITSRPEDDGMGLGVFIAKTLLEHTGATVRFSNRPEGGARVAIAWPRAILTRRPAGPA